MLQKTRTIFVSNLVCLLVVSFCIFINLSVLGQSFAEKQRLYPFRIGEKWGFSDSTFKLIIPSNYDEIDFLSNGYYSVRRGKQWGAINQYGKTVLEVNFDTIYTPETTSPNYFFLKKNGLMALADSNGVLMIPFEYPRVDLIGNNLFRVYKNQEEGGFGVHDGKKLITDTKFRYISSLPNGYILLTLKKHLFGLMNQAGNLVLQPKYIEIEEITDGLILTRQQENIKNIYKFFKGNGETGFKKIFSYAAPFSDGLAAVSRKGKKFGFINTDGKTVIDFIYDTASSFHHGYAIVKFKGKFGAINRYGKEAIPFIFDELEWQNKDNCVIKGHPAKAKYSYTSNYYFIRPDGLISDKYEFIDEFHNGFAKMAIDEKIGYMNKYGEDVIRPQFEQGGNVSDGVVRVLLNNKWGYVDTTGKVVIDFKFNYSPYVGDFFNGYALIVKENDPQYINSLSTLINKDRDYLTSFQWGKGFSIPFYGYPNPEFFPFILPNYYHYILFNKEGKRITNEQYTDPSSIRVTNNGLLIVCQNRACGFINANGKEIVPLKYWIVPPRNHHLKFGLFKAYKIDTKTEKRKVLGFIDQEGRKYWQD